MDNSVLIALISAGGAVIAALIAIIPHLLKNRDRSKRTNQGTEVEIRTSPLRVKMKGRWFGDNEVWDFEGDVQIDSRSARGRIWWTFVKCEKPSTKSASWLKRIGDSSYEDIEGMLDTEHFTLHLHGCKVGDSTLLALGVDNTINFSSDWRTFKGTTSHPHLGTGIMEGSASVEFK
jgi:hypothetical protein